MASQSHVSVRGTVQCLHLPLVATPPPTPIFSLRPESIRCLPCWHSSPIWPQFQFPVAGFNASAGCQAPIGAAPALCRPQRTACQGKRGGIESELSVPSAGFVHACQIVPLGVKSGETAGIFIKKADTQLASSVCAALGCFTGTKQWFGPYNGENPASAGR